MTLRPDDMTVGMPVIIESVIDGFTLGESITSDMYSAFMDARWLEGKAGKPAEIVGITLPFIAIRIYGTSKSTYRSPYSTEPERPGELHTIDTRRFRLIKCDPVMLASFVRESVPMAKMELDTVLGVALANRLRKAGISDTESLMSRYRTGMLSSMTGIGESSMRKIESLMTMAGVQKHGF